MNNNCPLHDQHAKAAAGEPAIELRLLSKSFPGRPIPVLDGINLNVPRGGFFGILGPNGSGKTTLMSILCGLLRPSAGSVQINGHDVSVERTVVKRILGMVPQEPAIYPTLTAWENLEFFGRMQGLSGDHLEARIQACLNLAEMTEQANQQVEHLSGGYKRRLNMVIGLIHEPEILILDEPTVAIDPHSRSLIHHRLRELHAAGITILISTHYMEEAEQLCQEIAIINHGKLLVQGTVPDLLAMHANDTIQVRLSSPPPPDLEQRLLGIPGMLEVTVTGRCVLAVAERPDQVSVSLMQAFQQEGLRVSSLNFGTTSLESVFLALTGNKGAPK